ncbi:AMP-binding protein [Paenibacillus apiarius]|uniref:AMP-binding protein n=1 Tax=Paenibacillus apiarius TaxID=46240 RepID=UPI002342CB99|nr:AMP-binding protein [Paenibacillus apiarius]
MQATTAAPAGNAVAPVGKLVPIGRPIPNHRVYIVDANDQLLPVGIAGEFCISGVGVARGYLNRPELTEERFVDNPFEPGARMYRTGDLAKWLPDGNIEYLGRIDHQVKIRGYRIELGEVEAQLLKTASVQEAVAIARDDGDGQQYLCAYNRSGQRADGRRAEKSAVAGAAGLHGAFPLCAAGAHAVDAKRKN